jgi:mono/diheme cytochrome c family protein
MMDRPEDSRAQQREHAEPSEYPRPIPLLAAAVTLAVVLFGAGYLLWSDSFGVARYGDRRTLADLASAPGASARAAGSAGGKSLFASHCAACHQATGLGLPGVFPPLADSEWVKGDERILANILLHGISGELVVKGAKYAGAMPSFGQLGDAELAAIATYVRGEWSNGAAPVSAERFAAERKTVTRTAPFAGGAELRILADSLHDRKE